MEKEPSEALNGVSFRGEVPGTWETTPPTQVTLPLAAMAQGHGR